MALLETRGGTGETERTRLFQDIFDREIYPRYFENLHAPLGQPTAIFIGGQPGCGKSVRERALVGELNSKEPNTAIEINGDDFRAFHPDYYQLLREDDATAASKIDKENKFFIEQGIHASVERGLNVIVEGTFRQSDIVRSTAELFGTAGYQTRGILLAVHPLLSRIGIMRRYFQQKKIAPFARYTERHSHDAALEGIPRTVDTLVSSGQLNEFLIVKRDGTRLFSVLLDSLSQESRRHLSTDAQNILQDTHETLSDSEIELALHELSLIKDAMEVISVPQTIAHDLATLESDLLGARRER